MIFTCITLSSEEMQRDMPSNVVYYNHVRRFSDVASLHNERLNSIKYVTTPYFYYCDYDDPIPELNIVPKTSILYGDNIYNQFNIERINKSGNWSEENHISNPYFIHKAICETELSLKLLDILPVGEYWTELLLFYSLALVGSSEYDPSIKMLWNKKQYGLHKDVRKAIHNTVLWLLNNQNILRNRFKQR